MKNLDQLAVYCGSAPGSDPAFADAARATAAAMVRRRESQLVYGGGRLGLMGLIADSVLELGGLVYGVIPQALVDIEVAHPSVTELHIVETMHERKAKMTELADAFLALPGRHRHARRIVRGVELERARLSQEAVLPLNVKGYWDGLIELHRPCDAERLHVAAAAQPAARRQRRPSEALELLDEAVAAATQGMVW